MTGNRTDKILCDLCVYVVQQLLKTEMPMNTGQTPDIQPICKSIEWSGRKPIRVISYE